MFENLTGKHVIVRTRDAGVHAGVLMGVDGDNVHLSEARRMWRWWAKKSISLSGVALHGLADRSEVRICGNISEMVIRGWCEILPTSETAQLSIAECKEAEA